MSRRSTPDRIADAWEAGTRTWLRTTLGRPDDRVDELLAAWAIEAEGGGLRRLDRPTGTRPGRGWRSAPTDRLLRYPDVFPNVIVR